MAKAMSITERVLRSINVDYDHPSLAKATPWLADWHDENGSKPSAAMLYVGSIFKKHGFGLEGMFKAMQLRPEGATVQAFMRATGAGGAAHNSTRAVVAAGYFERVKTQGPGQAETFTLRFTDQGEAYVNERMIADGLKKAPKAHAKAAKAKAVKVSRAANKAAKAVGVAADAVAEAEAVGVAVPDVAAHGDAEAVAGHDTLQQLANHFNS